MLKAVVLASCAAAAHSIAAPPAGWVDAGDAAASDLIRLSVGVKLQALDELKEAVLDSSDPKRATYGKHMTRAEAQALVAPAPASVAAVEDWLSAHGVACSKTATGSWLTCDVTVETAEQLLAADFRRYESVVSGKTILRTLDFALPAEVAAHVDLVGPTIRFPMEATLKQSVAAEDDVLTTPDYIRDLYGVGDYVAKTDSSVATANFLDQWISMDDLQLFFDDYAPSLSGDTVTKMIGPNNETVPGIESSLDIDYLMGVAQKAPFWFWSTAGNAPDDPENEPFLTWLQDVGSYEGDLPTIFSISYADYEDTVTVDYRNRVDAEFAQLTATGISFISGSGDAGVEGAQPRDCPGGMYAGVYPTDSYWVTSVGATEPSSSGKGEQAVSWSGGGFSWNQTVADYQKDAVDAFIGSSPSLPDSSLFNAGGRGFPDVSTVGVNFQVACGGKIVNVGGTSASTPTFSGMVGLLNDQRAAAGKSPLGFLNPLIYSSPDAFTDITEGSNPGCGSDGFTAQEGWDPITGLGTPIFSTLSKIVAELP